MTAAAEVVGIVAVDEDNGLGRDGDMAWRSSEDFKRFRRLTTGNALIMGRRTQDAIGLPLPGRTTVVVSRTPGAPQKGLLWARTPHEALQTARQTGAQTIYVGGGGMIYQALAAEIDRIELTRIPGRHGCDVTFPIDLEAFGSLASTEEGLEPSLRFETWLAHGRLRRDTLASTAS